LVTQPYQHRALVDVVAFVKIDRASFVAFEADVEELVGIGELRSVDEVSFISSLFALTTPQRKLTSR
jgi:hypothetical protein